jgi:hypothetical protein
MSHGCQDLLLIGASKSSRPNCGQLAAAAADAADGIGHAARSTTTRRAVCAILSQGGRPADKDQELKRVEISLFR